VIKVFSNKSKYFQKIILIKIEYKIHLKNQNLQSQVAYLIILLNDEKNNRDAFLSNGKSGILVWIANLKLKS